MAIGGNYTAGAGGPMRGVARVWQTEGLHAAAVELDLRQLPVRLWAAEIAVLRYTAAEMATEQTRRFQSFTTSGQLYPTAPFTAAFHAHDLEYELRKTSYAYSWSRLSINGYNKGYEQTAVD